MSGGTNSSSAPLLVGSKTESVSIRDFAFAPGNLKIPVGGAITFTNYDSVAHTATANDGSWDTGLLNKGESKTITFDKPGDYTYHCSPHPNMVARIQVQ